VRFSIKDQGTGIPREIIPRIFDPFFSTKETGHGLGLATAFSIVRRHNGWIDVESEPGAGSTLTVTIPASEIPPSLSTEQIPADHHGKGAVLVMDDETFMVEIMNIMLAKMGYSVSAAKDGNEALKLFMEAEKSGESFIASILDLTIRGGMGGRDILAAIRKINPDSIVIASSGYSVNPIMSKPKDYGFTDSIVKPFRKNDLTMLFKRLFATQPVI
jgi:CheY-like chemotaxis protein